MPQVDQAAQAVLLMFALITMGFGTLAAPLPVVPGPALVWFGATIYAVLTGFRDIGVIPVIVLTLLMILGSTTNIWLAALGVKATGGSFLDVVVGTAGMFVGLILFFPLGAIIGAVVAVLATEFLRSGSIHKALKVGTGTAGGWLLGVVAEFIISLVMDVTFIVALILAHR
ncbi:MAG: DUF456 domain-containing protein [Anaerolineae bacterium]|nr:DUF456 domain-containing protein [Anaerolineae bacterium]